MNQIVNFYLLATQEGKMELSWSLGITYYFQQEMMSCMP